MSNAQPRGADAPPLPDLPASVYLNVQEQHQRESEWCWAATTSSITNFYTYESPWTQCMLANRTFGQVNCCMDGGLSACNQPGYPDRSLTMTGHFATIVNGKPSLGTLMFELAAGRPVSIAIHWTSGRGDHNPAVIGYDNSNPDAPTIDIADPLYGLSTCDFHTFPEFYQGGANWLRSYLTHP